MSSYYQYQFISPKEFIAQIKLELKSYFDTGAIDDTLIPTWIDRCLRKIGKSSYVIEEIVMPVHHYECRLPDDFHLSREVWLCTNIDQMQTHSANSFYQQALSLETIKISPVITDVKPCDIDCSPDIIKAVYKTNEDFQISFKKMYLLKPGGVNTHKHCSDDCKYNNTSPDSFDIIGNKLMVSFREGHVYLIYYKKEYDAEGYQFIPDNYRITEYIMSFIKYKLFEMLSNTVIDETAKQIEGKLQKAEQKMNEDYIMMETELKKQTINKKIERLQHDLQRNNMYEVKTSIFGYNRRR